SPPPTAERWAPTCAASPPAIGRSPPVTKPLTGNAPRGSSPGCGSCWGRDQTDEHSNRRSSATPVVAQERRMSGSTTVTGDGSERLRRWRLVLGGGESEGTGAGLDGDDAGRDDVLDALYGDGGDGTRPAGRGGGIGRSSPRVARWLGDIRRYFPASVVSVLQRDAMERLGLAQPLTDPELLGAVQPDIHLVGTLLALRQAIPDHSRETARAVVRMVTDQLEARLAAPTRQAVTGALHRAARTRRPRAGDIDWGRTVAANLRHYQPELGTVIPERLVGYGRRSPQVLREIILCLDQSGSMAASVVYASVFAAVLASVRSLSTRLVVFDTAVVGLTEALDDPDAILFRVQLGGGTDISGASTYWAAR